MNEEVLSTQILGKKFSEFSPWGTRKIFFRVFDTSSYIFYYRTVYPDNLKSKLACSISVSVTTTT